VETSKLLPGGIPGWSLQIVDGTCCIGFNIWKKLPGCIQRDGLSGLGFRRSDHVILRKHRSPATAHLVPINNCPITFPSLAFCECRRYTPFLTTRIAPMQEARFLSFEALLSRKCLSDHYVHLRTGTRLTVLP